MADTTTTAYGLTKPEVGASEDTWGTKINTDLDTLDTVVNAIGGKTAAATLSYADAAKVVTSATGIDVTGKLQTSANNNGGAKGNYIRITDTDTTATANNQQGGIEFYTNDVTPGIAASIEVLYAGTGGGGEITFNTNATSSGTLTEAVRITETGSVGIGTNSIDGTLHVHTASAGTVTASPQADDLVIENGAEGGMTIITPDDQSARIRFTSPSTNTDVGGASIFYRQNINKMSIGTQVAGGKLAFTSGAGTEAIILDSSGAVTKPLQPAFNATPTIIQSNFAIGSAVTVVFDTERFDVGANFASSTFTAPVTGKYSLHAHLRLENVDTAAAYIMLRITTSNKEYQSVFSPLQFAADVTYWPIALNCLTDMDEDDTAVVTIYQSDGTAQTDISTKSYFNGILVA